MIDHLKHMANVRPNGADKQAAVWALREIDRLNTIITALCAQSGITSHEIARGIREAKYGSGPDTL